jgi:uncharacterized DUF497 family protein
MIRFEWDREKARANLAKHGVAFADAQLVWDDPHHILRFDRYEGDEERWQIVGHTGESHLKKPAGGDAV